MKHVLGVLFLGLIGVTSLSAAQLPIGFIESVVVPDVADALDFDWDSDGGLWIAGKEGQVWVVRESRTLALQITVETAGDAGIAALAVDPDYENNNYVWIFYLSPPPYQNRLSRFTNMNDTLVDETVILEIDSVSQGYNGGCVQFMPDGTIIVGQGFDGQSVMVQDPFSLKGKLLRINQDGSTPADNPYADGTQGNSLVWATGLRNPWRCSLQPATNALFVGDVGWNQWEDIHVAQAEGNYGFPLIEGPGQPGGTEVDEPLYSIQHQSGQNHAVIGGDFATAGNFPAGYVGDYFFADHNQQKITRIQFDRLNEIESIDDFGTDMNWPTSMKFGPDGALYYAAWVTDDIRKIQFIGEAGAGGRVPTDLIIQKSNLTPGGLKLYWNHSCNAGDTDYAIYKGTIPVFDVVSRVFCTTYGGLTKTVPPVTDSMFYLVVPHNDFWQGSFGQDSEGNERTPTGSLCHAQAVSRCN